MYDETYQTNLLENQDDSQDECIIQGGIPVSVFSVGGR
jgi:hypothetical protein